MVDLLNYPQMTQIFADEYFPVSIFLSEIIDIPMFSTQFFCVFIE